MAQSNPLFQNDDNDQEMVQERLDEFFSSVMGLLSNSTSQPKRSAEQIVTARRQVEEILLRKQTEELFGETV